VGCHPGPKTTRHWPIEGKEEKTGRGQQRIETEEKNIRARIIPAQHKKDKKKRKNRRREDTWW